MKTNLKRTISLTVAILLTICCNAQLEVYDTGTVGISNNFEYSWTRLLVADRDLDHDFYDVSTLSSSPGIGQINIGVEGFAMRPMPGTDGRSIGVRGMAGRGYAGCSYGAFGSLQGTGVGSGVGGSDGMTVGTADGRYAGLFLGDIAATRSTKARLVNVYDAPSTEGDTIGSSAPSLLLPMRAYIKRYRTDIVNADTMVQAGDGIRFGEEEVEQSQPIIIPHDIYEYHYSIIPNSGVNPNLMIDDAQGRVVVNYTELVPLMTETVWKFFQLLFGRNVSNVLSGDMSATEAAELSGWSSDDAAALLAVAVAREEITFPASVPLATLPNAMLMFFDDSGALLLQRETTVEERTTGNISQCPDGTSYCTILEDGMEVNTMRVKKY